MRLAAAALVLAACTTTTAPPPESGTTAVPFLADFVPFRTWTSFHSDGPVDDGTQPPGVLGGRTQYVNHVPPTGSTQFPIGTLIVEVRDSGTIFAAAKRGGDYNATGAINWEYWELVEQPAGLTYTWRGVGPTDPNGEYGGNPNTCNGCHVKCVANDYICSPKLQLLTLPWS